jgi:hypothetical protein
MRLIATPGDHYVRVGRQLLDYVEVDPAERLLEIERPYYIICTAGTTFPIFG